MTTCERLVDKAKEAFVMAIEIYNKPSINYRLEGFSFFICNAWELMLKAHMINKFGENSIYYPDKPNRTITLENCVQKIFTNEKAPLRKNLEKVIELRNTSTHFITEEYEAVYIPLLQACVFNFVDKMMEFHGVDMTRVIPENFITLSVRLKSLNETEIRGKYTEQVAERLITVQQTLEPMIEENNNAFAIRVEHYHYLTKDKNQATEFYHIEKEAADGVRILKELKDPNDTHKYNAKACIREINKRIQKEGIKLLLNGAEVEFNIYHFRLFTAYFGIKENERLCFTYLISTQPQYSYSQQAIDFIFEEIKKAPSTILDDLKKKMQKK
ncbi:MAG: DUF3644 domain-containing protein [Lachnospiraceae bacterium]|nr:DUF3644 domain-containing protein [Lachnospiraceae bacterium]